MFFPVCKGENRKSQINFILDGILINAAVILSTGVFLSGYMVYLNASDFMVGILNNAGSWALIISVFSFLIYERMERRKKLLITLNMTARFLLCGVIFLPLIFKNNQTVLILVTVMTVLGNVIWGIYATGVTVWMISLLSHKERSNYIYVRMFYLRISFAVTAMLGGLLMDFFNKSYEGFLVIFSMSLIFSLIDALMLSKTEEPANVIDKTKRFSLKDFFQPFMVKEYAIFLGFVLFFYMTFTISSSFTSLYLIRYLELDYSFISMINLVSHMFMIVCTRFWGRMENNRGVRYVIAITSAVLMAELFVYSFINKNTYYLLFLGATLSGIGNSGFNIGIVTYRYNIIPEGNKTIFEGWFSAIFGISTILGPILGNKIKNSLPPIHNAVYDNNFQILYLISFLSCTVVIALMFFRPSNIRKKAMNGRLKSE